MYCAAFWLSAQVQQMQRLKQTEKRTKKLSAPANEGELLEYYTACETAHVEPADTLRKLASAFAKHVAQNKSFTFPIRFTK